MIGQDFIYTNPSSPLPSNSREVAVYYESGRTVAPPYVLKVTFHPSGTVVDVTLAGEGVENAQTLEIPSGDDSGTITDMTGPSNDGGFTIDP